MRFAVLLLVSLVTVGSAWDKAELMKRTLDAADRALDFMERELRDSNLDGIIGMRMMADQLLVLLGRVGVDLQQCSNSWPLLEKILILQRKGDLLAEEGKQVVARTQPVYSAQLGLLIARGRWLHNYPTRGLSLNPQDKKISKMFDENASDVCLSEVLGTSLTKKVPACNITNSCWTMLTDLGLTRYYVTHEVLYLEVGEMAGCSRQMEALAVSKNGKNVSELQDYFCSSIFLEGKDCEKQGIPENLEDLLMEQIALCGILGYRDFLQPKWLDVILSHQEECGCYSRPAYKGKPIRRRRMKREDVKMKGGCSAHKTSVAIGALGVSIRFLVDEYLASQPCGVQ